MFDIHMSVHLPDNSDVDDSKVAQYLEELCGAFDASPEAKALAEEDTDWEAVYWMTELGINHIGVTPPEYAVSDIDEILFSLLPTQVVMDPESADAFVATLRAFWLFVQRQYQLSNAGPILARLDARGVARLRRELSDPSHFGMAKSFFMMGEELGFDMTSEEDSTAFMNFYNAQLLRNLNPNAMPGTMPPPGLAGEFPPLPPEPNDGMPRLTAKERAELRKKRRKADKRKGGKR